MARGSVVPRPTSDGKMRYRIKWETRSPDGKRVHHSATRRTRDEADRFLAKKLGEVNDGTFVVASKESVAKFLERWVEASAPSWSEATLYKYRSTIRRRIAPFIGDVPLAKLDELTIQHCYAQLITKGYAASSVAGTHSLLATALKRAVAWRLLQRNPAIGVKVPSVASNSPTTWSAAEAAAFITGTAAEPLGALWRLGLDSGMRVGEMLALTWRDLDVERGVIAVRRTLTRTDNGGWKIGEHAKTSSSRRAIHLDSETVTALRALRPSQNERLLACGAVWVDLDLIFDRGNGTWLDPQRVRYQFAAAVKRTKVPELT